MPLWAQLRDVLRRRIDDGEWGAGTMIASELDLCVQYDVSRITAARAVQELVREGLLTRQRGRGTVVAARRSAERRLPLVFVTPRFDGDWALDVYGGFESVAARAGHLTLLAGTGGARTLTATRIEALRGAQARGLAVFSHARLDDGARRFLPTLRRDGVPLVFVGTYDPEVPGDRVVADNVRASRLAAEHLLSLGHRRVAFIAPDAALATRSTSMRGRLAGYREALRGSDTFEYLDALSPDLSDGARTERLLGFLDASGATAAVTNTDAVALLVMRYLRAAGLRVPEHLALVGISDMRLAVLPEVPLTTVRIPAAELGAEAARLLLRRLEGDASPPQEVVVDVALVVRASCGARPLADSAAGGGATDGTREAAEALRAALDR